MAEITGPATDDKGRPVVQSLSDRELLEETVVYLRAFGDVLEQISKNPMLGAMMPGMF